MFATTACPREHPAAKSPTVKAGRAGHALDPPFGAPMERTVRLATIRPYRTFGRSAGPMLRAGPLRLSASGALLHIVLSDTVPGAQRLPSRDDPCAGLFPHAVVEQDAAPTCTFIWSPGLGPRR